MAIPSIDYIYLKWQQNKMIGQWQSDKNQTDIIISPLSVPEKELKKKPAEKPIEKQIWKHKEIMGVIKIPKIDVNCPIVQGVDKEALKLGIGHIETSALPGEIGNCALAGHRSYTYGKMFNRLGEMKVGDIVKISYNDQTFNYEVYSILIVEPDDISVLYKNDTDKILTLITCHPIRIANKRLIIHCMLK